MTPMGPWKAPDRGKPMPPQLTGLQRKPSDAATAALHRILIIDDDPYVGEGLTRNLRRSYQVTCVTSAAAALQLLENGMQFDVVLCDLEMPVTTGAEFYGELAWRLPAALPQIIFMTASV